MDIVAKVVVINVTNVASIINTMNKKNVNVNVNVNAISIIRAIAINARMKTTTNVINIVVTNVSMIVIENVNVKTTNALL